MQEANPLKAGKKFKNVRNMANQFSYNHKGVNHHLQKVTGSAQELAKILENMGKKPEKKEEEK